MYGRMHVCMLVARSYVCMNTEDSTYILFMWLHVYCICLYVRMYVCMYVCMCVLVEKFHKI